MRIDGLPPVSHETIYRYILRDKYRRGKLSMHLRHKHKRYKKRYGSNIDVDRYSIRFLLKRDML